MPKKPSNDDATRPIFSKGDELFDDSLQKELEELNSKPVVCLGRKFPNDLARRAYYLERLREHLADPEFQRIQGMPVGDVERILDASDPPYHTACPNPFIPEMLAFHKRQSESAVYHREPFATDVEEGKSDPLYQAHSYHTKVPYKAIQKYIEHFTEPGDLVLDAFGGTGMTGVAAHACGRRAIVVDLSPYASFIARGYLKEPEADLLEKAADAVIAAAKTSADWVYRTNTEDGAAYVLSAVWADHYFCPACSKEASFWEWGVGGDGALKHELTCPSCGAVAEKRDLEQVRPGGGEVKRSIVQTSFRFRDKRVTNSPGPDQSQVLDRCNAEVQRCSAPDIPIMFIGQRFGDMYVPRQHTGLNTVKDFYLPRAAIAASAIWDAIARIPDETLRAYLRWAFLSVQSYINKKQSFFGGGGGQPGTLTIADVILERNVFDVFERKVKKLVGLVPLFARLYGRTRASFALSCQSATDLRQLPSSCVDYVFTDPPFGRNLMYSELNFINEAWLGVYTNTKTEAIVNRSRKWGRAEYFEKMRQAFAEYFRVLRNGRWITVEFHNSSSAIWNGIQEALTSVGFVIAQVAILDKSGLTFKQLASPSGAVSKDLVISAYKPSEKIQQRASLGVSDEGLVYDFVREHLSQVAIPQMRGGMLTAISERQRHLLFDRVVAFHVQRGLSLPVSSAQFYEGLAARFAERDDMFFLSEQVAEYDRRRSQVRECQQLELFPHDEESAIQWLRQRLRDKPSVYSEIMPEFAAAIGGWDKHEEHVELSVILNENFLRYDDDGPVPSQIHAYLSSNFKELRSLEKDNPVLKAKARERWYVADPRKMGDLEKLRERALLKEFEEYRTSKAKTLKVFRVEAMRAGFKAAYDKKDYATIVETAEKLPETVLQEDEKLLMYYDVASMRLGSRDGKSELF